MNHHGSADKGRQPCPQDNQVALEDWEYKGDKKGPMKSPWLAEGSLVIFMQVHSLRSGLKLPFQKV